MKNGLQKWQDEKYIIENDDNSLLDDASDNSIRHRRRIPHPHPRTHDANMSANPSRQSSVNIHQDAFITLRSRSNSLQPQTYI